MFVMVQLAVGAFLRFRRFWAEKPQDAAPPVPSASYVTKGSTAGGAKDPETFLKVGLLAPSAPLPPMPASGSKGYPSSAGPLHLFRKVALPGVCVA